MLTLIMLITISQYGNFQDNVGFLLYKQEYIGNNTWKVAFYIHVFSCFFCLLAGFTQFSNSLIQNNKILHKLFGRLYAYNILLINFPVGLVLAICANGYLPSKLAFLTLDFLWFTFTLQAVVAIRNGEILKHKEYMIRSYALTLSALSLRLWKLVFVTFTAMDNTTIYMIDAWIGFLINLLIAEIFIRRNRQKLSFKCDIKSKK
ncbi:MAG: DUF2306 domain-containing protein [Sporocytophaga sp.]|nr:DUF2306 domain-containing protein [Sporocytophaga sp.]